MNHPTGAPARAELANSLSVFLANSYCLYLKTQNFHWNVTGLQFHSLHQLFETQYSELAQAIDALAERIRTLGHLAPGSFRSYLELATLPEAEGGEDAQRMLVALSADHEAMVQQAHALIQQAESAGDQGTQDLLAGRLAVHELAAWMLRSSQG